MKIKFGELSVPLKLAIIGAWTFMGMAIFNFLMTITGSW